MSIPIRSAALLFFAFFTTFTLVTGAASAQTSTLVKKMVDASTNADIHKDVVQPTSATTVNGNADLTIPNLGQGFNIVPTPSFNFTQTSGKGKSGFLINVWGNSLGTDSNRQKVAGNFLMPQISLLGFLIDGSFLFPLKGDFKLGAEAEINLLVKKISFYDSGTKIVTNFNPFVVQPKVGLTSSFLNNYAFVNAYVNLLTVLTQNNQFKTFFPTNGKTTFVYPEIDAGGYFNTKSGGSQYVKFEFDILINNGEIQPISGSNDKIIPYVKVGYVTSL